MHRQALSSVPDSLLPFLQWQHCVTLAKASLNMDSAQVNEGAATITTKYNTKLRVKTNIM